MANYDLLKKIRSTLLADSLISEKVGNNVRVAKQPVCKSAIQITLKRNYGKSNSIIPATNFPLFVSIWVKQQEVVEPYSICALLVEKVIDLLNRKGVSLNEEDLEVNQVVKTDADIQYDEEQERWVGIVIFDVVTNEG